jgi:hypothetical protein
VDGPSSQHRYQAVLEEENEPLHARVAVVDSLLDANRTQLERLLDLYLEGDFPCETLTDRKVRLEKTISALEEERAGLAARLETGALTDEQIQRLERFVSEVAYGLDVAGVDHETRRGVIEVLDVQATLSVRGPEGSERLVCGGGEQLHFASR